MWRPEVSVVMCTYNGAAFIAQQLESILAQTYPIAEILIFDDGSTDETLAILSTYTARHSSIRLHRNRENLGFNRNFEQGLKHAAGEVIAIADQDDYWLPQKLERMIAVWKSKAPLIHCDSQRFKGALPNLKKLKPKIRRFQGTDTARLFLFNSVNGHAMMLRRSFLPKVLPLESGIYYDWWAAVVASCNGGVAYLPETLVLQRLHAENASVDKSNSEATQFRHHRQLLQAHLIKFATAPNVSSDAHQLALTLVHHFGKLEDFHHRYAVFLLILRNRKTFFYQKQKPTAFFSHLKYAWQWSMQ